MTRHIYLISIKNRKKYVTTLVNQLKEKYTGTKYKLCFSVTDFNSTDCDVDELFKSFEVDYYFTNINSEFNLGLGWNTSAHNTNISKDEIIVFTCNDIKFTNSIKIHKIINNFTIQNESIFIPVHNCEDENGKLQFAGGAAFWSCYKSDFLKIGDIPESETWSDAFTLNGNKCGEEDYFMSRSSQIGFELFRWQEKGIIASWHPRDFSEKWYGKSKCVEQRQYKKYTPSWWTIK